MGTIRDMYEDLTGDRQDALRIAQEVERLTSWVGALDCRPKEQLYVSSGRRGLTKLSSVLVQSLFARDYFRFTAGKNQEKAEAAKLLATVKSDTLTQQELINARASDTKIAKSVLVAGCVLVNETKGRIRTFPIRKFVMDRHGDRLRRIVVKETPDRRRAPDYIAKGEVDRDDVIYTLIDFTGEGSVQQEKGKAKPQPVSDSKPEHWYVPAGTEPDEFGWPTSYLYEIEPDLWSIDAFRAALHQIVEVTAKIIGLVHPESGLDPRQVAHAKTGQFFSGDPNSAIGYASAAGKIGDFGLIRQMVADLEGVINEHTLAQVEAQIGNTDTAYAAGIIARLIDAHMHGFHSVMADTWLRPHVYASMDHAGYPAKGTTVRPTVLTGAAAYARRSDWDEVMEAIGQLKAIDPRMLQLLDRQALVDRRFESVRDGQQLMRKFPKELKELAGGDVNALIGVLDQLERSGIPVAQALKAAGPGVGVPAAAGGAAAIAAPVAGGGGTRMKIGSGGMRRAS